MKSIRIYSRAFGPLLMAVLLLVSAKPALANWWIVRSSDGECLVVDIEPTGTGVTKVGKEVYQTQEQAEADAKALCKEPKLNVPREEKDQ
jgi:hypothetical protein